jgi:hypothetical protein
MAGAWMVQQRTGNSGWVDACEAYTATTTRCVDAALVRPRYRGLFGYADGCGLGVSHYRMKAV